MKEHEITIKLTKSQYDLLMDFSEEEFKALPLNIMDLLVKVKEGWIRLRDESVSK